jgi:hypothetical protein
LLITLGRHITVTDEQHKSCCFTNLMSTDFALITQTISQQSSTTCK